MSRIPRFFPLFAILTAACDESAPRLDTGLPVDLPADQVMGADAVASCQRYEDLANQALGADVQIRLACVVEGIVAEIGGVATCSSVAGACLASPPAAVSIDFACESAVSFAPSGCTATIGELEACVNEVSQAIASVTRRIDCGLARDLSALVDVRDAAVALAAPTQSPSCVNLSNECLGLLGWVADAAPTVPGP